MREKMLAIADRLEEWANQHPDQDTAQPLYIVCDAIRTELQEDTETISELCERIDENVQQNLY